MTGVGHHHQFGVGHVPAHQAAVVRSSEGIVRTPQEQRRRGHRPQKLRRERQRVEVGQDLGADHLGVVTHRVGVPTEGEVPVEEDLVDATCVEAGTVADLSQDAAVDPPAGRKRIHDPAGQARLQ